MVAAASTMAEYPERLKKLFVNEENGSVNGISNNGIYAVQIYALMEPIIVTIDDRLPFYKNTDYTVYASMGNDGSAWGPLLEKAFAKL